MNNKEKKSQLVWDMKIVRKLLKMNGELKFCPYCGKSLKENCECKKNIIIDVKPLRDGNGETIAVFDNNAAFKQAHNEIIEELKAKKEATENSVEAE